MADPIPTIADVLDRYKAGTCTLDQALVWMDVHIGQAVDAACNLDEFAGRAMQVLLADRWFVQDAKNKKHDINEAVAEAAYEQARAMKIARSI